MNNPILEFELITDRAELLALSKISLERPLTDLEFQKMKELGEKIL